MKLIHKLHAWLMSGDHDYRNGSWTWIAIWFFFVAMFLALNWEAVRRWATNDYSETEECVNCGDKVTRTRMYHDDAYGWFCNKKEFDQFLGWNIPG